MTTKQIKEAKAAVLNWCRKHKVKLIAPPNHIHPRTFVVGYAAARLLIVRRCWQDSEPQCREWDKKYPLETVHEFDESLKEGDWCITAYIQTDSYGQPIAIPYPRS